LQRQVDFAVFLGQMSDVHVSLYLCSSMFDVGNYTHGRHHCQ
jgi:hypothetical protein